MKKVRILKINYFIKMYFYYMTNLLLYDNFTFKQIDYNIHFIIVNMY